MKFKPHGPENNNKLYKNSKEKDGNVKQARLKDQKHSTSREAVFSSRLLHCCLQFFLGISIDRKKKLNYGATENVSLIQTRIAHRTRQAPNL